MYAARRKSAKELRSERGFSFLSDFLTVKGKDRDFSLHKKICKPNESTIYRDFI
jgi:hypothetical protein